jgi:hypothetical protein
MLIRVTASSKATVGKSANEDIGRMSMEPTEEIQAEQVTEETSSIHAGTVEPAKLVDGPRIHLYTSLSSGSSYVRPIFMVED